MASCIHVVVAQSSNKLDAVNECDPAPELDFGRVGWARDANPNVMAEYFSVRGGGNLTGDAVRVEADEAGRTGIRKEGERIPVVEPPERLDVSVEEDMAIC